MKSALALGALLLATLAAGGCVSGAPSGGVRCLSRPDTTGTQPILYLLCIQSG